MIVAVCATLRDWQCPECCGSYYKLRRRHGGAHPYHYSGTSLEVAGKLLKHGSAHSMKLCMSADTFAEANYGEIRNLSQNAR
jgi:hypothetical protein